MPPRWGYDLMYRKGAPWERQAREELVALVESGRLAPAALTPGRALDVGCGSGNDSLFLAERGFTVTGADFSPVGLEKARTKAQQRGLLPEQVRFVQADLTADFVPGIEGTYELVVDNGLLMDLPPAGRMKLAATIERVTRPGSILFLWCWYGTYRGDLPVFSLKGRSRLWPGIRAGEQELLFGSGFTIERLPEPTSGAGTACFLMTRR